MRTVHLLGLRPGGKIPHFRLTSEEPLVLPSFVLPEHQHDIVTFYQLAVAPNAERIEIDWYGDLRPAQQKILAHTTRTRGSEGAVIVVRVGQPEVDLEVLAASELWRPFRNVVIVDTYDSRNAPIGALGELNREVEQLAANRYRELVDTLELRPDGWRLVSPLVQTLLDPVEILDVLNSLVEVQVEGLAPEHHYPGVLNRSLIRLLRWRAPADLIWLCGWGARRQAEAEALLAGEAEKVRERLTHAYLLCDGEPRRWLPLLRQPDVMKVVFAGQVPAREQYLEGYGDQLRTVVSWARESGRPVSEVYDDILGLIEAAELERAWQALRGLEGRRAEFSPGEEHNFLYYQAVLLARQGRLLDAEAMLKQALELGKQGDLGAAASGVVWHEYAGVFLRQGRRPEAEAAFRMALELKEQGGDTATSSSITWHEYACGLRDHGAWPEAEAAFRKALELKERGEDTATSRGITWHAYACGLRDQGAWPEAEAAFRKALGLGDQGGDTARSLGITWHEYARGLRDHGAWPEAEAAFRKALELGEEGGDSPELLAIAWDEFAAGLSRNGRMLDARAARATARRLRAPKPD